MRHLIQMKSAEDYGVLAQLGEHLPYKQRVIGSSPIGPITPGGIAQLARARGSYPRCRWFKSNLRYESCRISGSFFSVFPSVSAQREKTLQKQRSRCSLFLQRSYYPRTFSLTFFSALKSLYP